MSLEITVTEGQIAEAIIYGDLTFTSLIRNLAREVRSEPYSLLALFEDAGNEITSLPLPDAVREFGEDLACIAHRFHDKLLMEEDA